jgi:pimeloyl-ACP methyl ester carboxylesterase
VHGFPTSSHLWSNLVALLPAGHRIVVPDLLGFGRSDLGERADVSIGSHANRMIGLLDTLGIARACLVGHHMGASIATTVAERAPNRVTHLALLHSLGGDVTLTGTLPSCARSFPSSGSRLHRFCARQSALNSRDGSVIPFGHAHPSISTWPRGRTPHVGGSSCGSWLPQCDGRR